jgi:AcrR family transcriptional regulator
MAADDVDEVLPPRAPGLPPHSREPVQDLMAILLATGRFTDADVAARCGVSRQTVHTWCSSPLFQALIESYKQKFADQAIDRVLDAVLADADANWKWLQGLRGNAYDTDPKVLRLQLRAAEVLFDRQLPKRAERPVGDPARVLGEAVLRRLEKAAADDDGPIPVDGPVGPRP